MHIKTIVESFGAPCEVVKTAPLALPDPPPGHVRLRMLAAAINPSDLVTISGAYASRTKLPFTPGFEGVGVVEALGAGVEGLRIGERVLPIGSAGTWADAKIAEASWCYRVPPDLTHEQAATSYINPLTALLMLNEPQPLAAGAWIGVDAAGSAIGRMLLRMAAARGARTLAIVRHARSLPLLDGLPVTRRLVLPEDASAQALLEELGPTRLDLALDAVGGATGEALAAALRPGGRLVHYGLLSGRPLPPDLARRRPDIDIRFFWLRNWVHTRPRTEIEARLAECRTLLRQGPALSPVEARYPLAEITQALAHAMQPGRRGKILLVMGEQGGDGGVASRQDRRPAPPDSTHIWHARLRTVDSTSQNSATPLLPLAVGRG